MTEPAISRRGLIAAGAGAAALGTTAVASITRSAPYGEGGRVLSAANFGAVGDGSTDDTRALQLGLDAAFNGSEQGILIIPPGNYRVTRTLRISPPSHVARLSGIIGHGARLMSDIGSGQNVLEVSARSTFRFLFIEGLDILGRGREGHGLVLACERKDHYLYNFCLRDVVVQNCGGDGCYLSGNVFEGQIINSYFRKNGGNGATFEHGAAGGILSSVHVFGCVFGDNGRYGAAMLRGCFDVCFHGCYFLLSGRAGLFAENGCNLLSNCGFENNHQAAGGFADENAGIVLQTFGTLIGCTGYSVFKQSRLIRAALDGRLVMIGCSGSGDGQAKAAGLARIGSAGFRAAATIVGCSGAIAYDHGFDGLEVGMNGAGVKFGSNWRSPTLPQLGEYRLWVDAGGRLRMKRGPPVSDTDGTPVGT